MRLLRLQLAQYRNYPSLDLLLEGDLQLFLGENAAGKTNILEAISVLSLQQSFIGADEEDLRSWGTEYYRIRGEIQSDAGEKETLEIVSQVQPRKSKACFRNDVKVPASSLVGRLPSVAFLPQDLALFSGPPAERRRFFDQILSQTLPRYHRALSEYQRAMKQRNTLLRRIAEGRANASELDPWDAKLAEEGSAITVARLELVETFGMTLAEELAALGEKDWKDVHIRFERSGNARNPEELAVELRDLLKHFRERDLILQATSVGPHRDDWHMEVGGRSLLSFASRGQQRVCVLALLLLEASYLDLRRGERPVILLDDIFSELDDRHQSHVLASLAHHQVLCTATHLPPAKEGMKTWKVVKGSITPLQA